MHCGKHSSRNKFVTKYSLFLLNEFTTKNKHELMFSNIAIYVIKLCENTQNYTYNTITC